MLSDLGYGRFQLDGRCQAAHRVAWELFRNPIPPGLCILHRCDNRKCVNPDHLFIGSQQENIADMVRKGRQRTTHGEASHYCKLSDEDVRTIRQSSEAPSVLAARYSVHRNTIWHIRTERQRRDILTP